MCFPRPASSRSLCWPFSCGTHSQGLVDLDAPRTIDPRNRVGGTGILCELGTDYTPSLRDLAKLMIVLSDNIATNEIMDVIGMERFNSFCREMGYQNITLMRKMMDFEAIQQGKNNYMCAGETGRLLSAISRGEFVNPEISQTIFDIMASQQCRNKLPALLPAVASYSGSKSAIPEGQVLVANKTGDLVGIQHDVGIFELPDGPRYLIAMFTGDLEERQRGASPPSPRSPWRCIRPFGTDRRPLRPMRSAARKGGAPVLSAVLRQNGLYGSIRP